MEETIAKKQKYELAFHLNSEISEKDLEQKMKDLEEYIASLEGTIVKSRMPKRIKLAYPINGQLMVNFGSIDFDSPKSASVELDKKMKTDESVLRFIIIERQEVRPMRTERYVPKKKFVEESKPEEIEKKLEEILDKI